MASSDGVRTTLRGTAVSVIEVSHRFGDVTVLDGVSLEIGAGEFLSLLGPSGSGKTTLLKTIAGLNRPIRGRVFIDGNDVTDTPSQKRGIGFVFQNYALFPHLSVFENVAYPLRVRRRARDEIDWRVQSALQRVNLGGMERRYPAQLSGGEQQRVALARVLVYEPRVLLMDEPLGALDRKLRRQLQVDLKQLQRDLGFTCIYVTHDQEEALTMSDRVAVMHVGRILQVDKPMQLYRSPANRFVAEFVGEVNLIECEFLGGPLGDRGMYQTARGSRLWGPPLPAEARGRHFCMAIRPEFLRIVDRGDDVQGAVRLTAKPILLQFAGSVLHVVCETENGERLTVQADGSRAETFLLGSLVVLGWNVVDVGLFPVKVAALETAIRREMASEER